MPRSSPEIADFQISRATQSGAAKFDLEDFDPADTPFSSRDKTADKALLVDLAGELDRLQDVFFADRRFGLLIVLQGMDASGKDGTVRGVFSQMSDLGVHAVAWKVPSEEERSRDFLWRIHRRVPAQGEIIIFNRSHYEDVLVPVVEGSINAEQTRQRLAQINDFERLLTQSGTVICKFFLLISKDEQRERLQARLDDPNKRWKFAAGDLQVRKKWDPYHSAYQAAISATGTPWAPWTIVPADSKMHRNLMIATAVKQTLAALKLRYPVGDPALANVRVV